MLTNARILQLYKVIFAQPIDSKLVFEINLSDPDAAKACAECLQYLHRDAVLKKGLHKLWNNFMATEKTTIASIMLSKPAISFISKQIRSKFKSKFDEKVVVDAVRRTLSEPINLEEVKVSRTPSGKRKAKADIRPADVKTPVIGVPTNNLSVQ